MSAAIATVEAFYAHALAIEREAAERYSELAAWFENANEPVAKLCHRLAVLEREHFDELAAACATLALPEIPGAGHRWLGGGAPEVAARELSYHVASPRQLLEIALEGELRAHAFFVGIARTAPQRAVRELAAIMAAEENEHADWVRAAIADLAAARPT